MEDAASVRTAPEESFEGEALKIQPHLSSRLHFSNSTASLPHRLDFSASSAFCPPQYQDNDLLLSSDDVLATRNHFEPKSRLLNQSGDKTPERRDVANKKGPLRLLDLPLDVLHLVVKEVTHTNDLVALSLTTSALHRLAIAQIYSRFDIVWPDNSTQAETRTGVDALTYGLATLVMSGDAFGESPSMDARRPPTVTCTQCGHCNSLHDASHQQQTQLSRRPKRRRGNYYAEFTRKFSLGNGPEDWIKEYLSNTESGKMLGTLVALAVARMHNLETFIWDMPTGILLDVWNALASLSERPGAKLEKIWIRWHNNSPLVDGKFQAVPTPHTAHTFWLPYSRMTGYSNVDKRNKVERPNFSMLSPLKSLNVLDIDECLYLDEMSILISESLHCLKELRIGIASHAVSSQWAFPAQEEGLSQLAEGKSRFTGNISLLERRLGGVLGVLTGFFFDLKKHQMPPTQLSQAGYQEVETKADGPADVDSGEAAQSTTANHTSPATRNGTRNARFVEDIPPLHTVQLPDHAHTCHPSETLIHVHNAFEECRISVQSKLRLEILALERVSLSIPVLSEAFDWTTIRELTLIDCQFTPTLWSFLRRRFTPTSDPEEPQKSTTRVEFPLNLRKIHTNTVTPVLLAFMKETLAPNTLEILLLQQSQYHLSTKVSNYDILRVLRRHRGSLRKVLIDSSERDDTDNGSPLAEGWDRWIFDRKMIHFVTSGKCPNLREIGMAMFQRDWHYLLQRLPLIPQIRALYLPYIAKTGSGYVSGEDARELAFQVLDILTLRPDVELCYLAIANKCFEIIESRVKPSDLQLEDGSRPEFSVAVVDDLGDDGEVDEEDDEDDEEEGEDSADGHEDGEAEESDRDSGTDEGDVSSDDEIENDPSEDVQSRVKMEVREILFYDDKVAIFKARHGRL